jgi:hypothetical protein
MSGGSLGIRDQRVDQRGLADPGMAHEDAHRAAEKVVDGVKPGERAIGVLTDHGVRQVEGRIGREEVGRVCEVGLGQDQ